MNLKWVLCTRNLHPHEQLREKLREKIKKLEVHLEHFPADAVHLQVSIEKHPRKPLFESGLTLRLPSNMLRARKSAADPITAFDHATRAILREIAGLKSALRHESQWHRLARRMRSTLPRGLKHQPALA